MSCRIHGAAYFDEGVCEACVDEGRVHIHGIDGCEGCMACVEPERYDDHTCVPAGAIEVGS